MASVLLSLIRMKKKTSKRKSKAKKKKTAGAARGASSAETSRGRRGLWKGSIAFGLVNIPILLESAQQEEKIHFRLLDKRDHSPVGYKQINKKTEEEISHKDIVKGYEYEKGEYVLMSDADFKKANPKATKTIDIEDFVALKDVDPLLFDRPYYVIPQKGGEKGYVLLREVLEKTGKAAVAKIVLHTVQHLALLVAREDYIVLELLRFADEVKELHEVDYLDAGTKRTHVTQREIEVAEQLVQGMSSQWRPDKYQNTYRDDLMKLIKNKIKRGATAEVEEVEPAGDTEESAANVIDLTALLKKSLNASKKPRSHART
jgi:DNA end-binding protein Ku